MYRSALMVAGDKQKHLDKIESLGCDIAIINLEDGVFDKDHARALVLNKLHELKDKEIHAKKVVRVNSLDECGKEDIEAFNESKPDAIRVPKIQTAEDVKTVLDLVDKNIEIHLSIETKEALYSIADFKQDDRVSTLYLGILDLLESFSLTQSMIQLNNPSIDYILSKFLLDSLANHFTPVFFTFQDYRDTEQFEKWCIKAKQMGYRGSSCISPAQVEIANRIFLPDENEIEKARYIIEQFEYFKHNKNITGFKDEKFGFIDEPIYKNALNIIKYS